MVDSKILLFSTILVLAVSLIPTSEATLNLEDMSILSDDGSLVIEFGKNIMQTQSKKTTPILNFGLVQTKNHDFMLDSDSLVKIYGNSFVIKSLGDFTVLIYAQSVGGANYLVNVYTTENGFKRQSFSATLKATGEIESVAQSPTEALPEMKILVKQTDRVYWKNSYFVAVRVFDSELNRFNEFDQNWGHLSDIDVTVEIFDANDELLTTLSGTTGPHGFFDAEYYVVDRLVQKGEYTVLVTADDGFSQKTKTLSMFVLGQLPKDSGP